MKILITPPKEMKTKRQYSKPDPPFPQNPHQKNNRKKKKACNGAINRAF